MALEPIAVGPARFRVGPWHQQVDIAHLIPLTTAPTLGREVLARARERLGSMGFESIFTAAVGPDERDAMLRDEFRVHEELHLLRLDLRRPVHQMPRSRHHPRLRRGRRRDHAALLRLDASAFGEFWRLDRDGLQDALAATPASRLRVTDDAARSGYSITGRSGQNGYLQRLAVAPDAQRRGLGSVLLADSLRWLRRRGVTSVLVNTQLDNQRALELYQRAGFELETDRLSVMHRVLT